MTSLEQGQQNMLLSMDRLSFFLNQITVFPHLKVILCIYFKKKII